ncbi:hypothetical protein BDZ45DRAFT_772222 [Acephala macrosclerotiorum]|nr:hypothetical protein BDZ45DRAFT_772222 [Acephala macrosclerotiorum]
MGQTLEIQHHGGRQQLPKDLNAISATYNTNGDLFCKSQPRFWMYDNLSPDGYIPYFVNGLQVNPDGTDANPSQVLDSSYWATQTPPPVIPDDPAPPVENTKRNLKNLNSRHYSTRNYTTEGQHVVRNNITEMRLRSSYINANVMKDHLVTSNATAHSASKLCNDPSTAGPDFVSLDEKMFCDMASKQVYPLYHYTRQEACFDLDGSVFRPGALGKRDPNLVIKNYVKRIDW